MRYDFALFFTVLTVLTGAIWLTDALFFARARRDKLAAEQLALGRILDAAVDRVRKLASDKRIQGVEVARSPDRIVIVADSPEVAEKFRALIEREMPELVVAIDGSTLEAGLRDPPALAREPVVVEYSRSLFPVILIILLVRSFLGEPYRIPSKSMMPTLVIGDFILVNKYAYGLRLPVLDTKIVSVGEPQRGDVIVFHPPVAPDQVWIKRVIGLPGDVIDYHNYQLTVNGQPVPTESDGAYVGRNSGTPETGEQLLRESLPGHVHDVLSKQVPPLFQDARASGTWRVPAGEYFMMGDNRDNSEDGRFWPTNFLPERNIVGKAVLVWMNFDWDVKKMDSSRIGTIIR